MVLWNDQNHKTKWAMRPIIFFTGSLMYPIGVWADNKFQQVLADTPAYFKDSKVLKEQLTTTELPSGTMLLTADAMSMYTKIKNRPALKQIDKYFNGNKTKYRHLPVNDMPRALSLIMKNKIFRFGHIHSIQLKGTSMGTPPAPTYAAVFYGVFELFLLEIFGNNLLLYRRFIDDVLDLWKRYDEEKNVA